MATTKKPTWTLAYTVTVDGDAVRECQVRLLRDGSYLVRGLDEEKQIEGWYIKETFHPTPEAAIEEYTERQRRHLQRWEATIRDGRTQVRLAKKKLARIAALQQQRTT